MNDANLIIVGAMFIVVIVAQFIQANMVMARFEKLERAVREMALRQAQGPVSAPVELPPWDIEKSTINEADFGD